VVVTGAHSADFKEASDAVKHMSLPTPCVARMRIGIITAIEAPEARDRRHDRLVCMPHRGEALVCLHMLVMGT